MNDPINIFIGIALGALVAVGLIWFGYWMGRNSSDKPVRSHHNPSKTQSYEYMAPIDEPEGDLFNDAAYGTEGNTRGISSTMIGR